MNEKFNKTAKVEQLTKVVLSHGEEKGLIVKDPYELMPNKRLCNELELSPLHNTISLSGQIIYIVHVFNFFYYLSKTRI